MTTHMLTSADFTPHLHDVFFVQLAHAEPIPLELTEVAEWGPTDHPHGERRPFSLLFRGPASNLYLLQHTYELQHKHLGQLAIFLVPLGPEAGRMRYQAIFS